MNKGKMLTTTDPIDGNKPFDMAYLTAVKAIKEAIQRSQARALHAVSSEVLSLNYGIGRYISENSRKGFWGIGALAHICRQLQKEMPGLRGRRIQLGRIHEGSIHPPRNDTS